MAAWWLTLRAAAFVVMVLVESDPKHDVRHDVHYFDHRLAHLPVHGLAHTLVEYPLPALLLLALPWLLAHLAPVPYAATGLFVLAMLAVDASFATLLQRRRAHWTAAAAWVVGVPLLGAMSYFRFDLVPAVLVGLAVLVLATRPRLALGAVTVATAIKFWPVLVVPPTVAGVRDRWRALGLVAALGGAVALVCLALAGPARLVSPLTYDAHRGLHIESVWATPAMLGWAFGPYRWLVSFSPYKAFEVAGYGVPALLVASTVSALVVGAGLVVLWWRLLRRPGPVTPEAVAWVALAGVTGFVATGKVFSPQYLLWLLAIVVAGLAVTNGARALRTWAVLLLVAIALTHAFYPGPYQGFLFHDRFTVRAVTLLTARNLLVVWLLGSAFVHSWRVTGSRD
jgi:hypothetical protein